MGIPPAAGAKLIPIFFITVACGIVSGFHSTQTAIISRSMNSEKEGRVTFYNMMIAEGFIAMVWAAAAMAVMNKGVAGSSTAATDMVGIVSLDMLGPIGGILAILGVIVLPITSGDTALRSLRLMISDYVKLDQKPQGNRLKISLPIFVVVAAILVWAKFSPDGFTALWRYFAWSNQTLAVFAFALISIYLIARGYKLAFLMSLLPGVWYAFITLTYIINAKIGFNVPMNVAYVAGAALSVGYGILVYWYGAKHKKDKASLEEAPIYE